ncbi:hypothetical protein V1282_007109 [Nitrobacteraceae bacterium AZCC 2146]
MTPEADRMLEKRRNEIFLIGVEMVRAAKTTRGRFP